MEPWDQFKQMFNFIWDKFDMKPAKRQPQLDEKINDSNLEWIEISYLF